MTNNNAVSLTIKADTTAFATSIRQAEREFSSRFSQMGKQSRLHSGRIRSNFDSISDSAGKFTSNLKQAAKQLVLIGGAVTGVGLLGKRMLDTADSMAKTADRVGVTTNLLQELRFAASQSGVSTVKLETSLERFTKRIGEAATGTGAAASTYQRLGLSVTNVDGSLRSSGEVLNDVADALASLDTQAEKAAVTAALFGREGVALSLLLNKGAKGLTEYRERARELGLVIDEELLRSSEKAVDQLDILSRIIKAQIVTAFVQFAPQIVNFTQSIVAAIPSIKEFAAGLLALKDNLIVVSKTLLGIKIVSLAQSFFGFSKSMSDAGKTASKFAASMGLVSKALKGLGVGLAIGVAIDALSIFKQQLDLKKQVENYLQSQKTIINTNQQFADVTKLQIAEFSKLSVAEQKSYRERITGAQKYWQARLSLESRQQFDSPAALQAAKENRILLGQVSQVETFIKQRESLERKHVATLNKIKKTETNAIKQNLVQQLNDFDEANKKLTSLQNQRKEIAQDFQNLIQDINQAPNKSEADLTVLDIINAQQQAESSLKSGNIQQAFNAINQAKNVIQTLSKTDKSTKAFLTEQATATAAIADKIAQAQINEQQQNVDAIKQKIAQLKADAELLNHLSVKFDIDSAKQSADEMRAQLQAQLEKNPLKIATLVIPESGTVDDRANTLLKPQKRARGGIISGPGTSMSDSILARLSRGEYVVRASAVKRYGLSFLNSLNQSKLPQFAHGGMVLPELPTSAALNTASNSVANLTLNLGNQHYTVQTQNIDVVQALTKAVAREALKSGRRI